MASNPDPHRRIELPLLQVGRGNHKSCRWGCGDACSKEPPNRSGNETYAAVVERALSRRAFLAAGGVGALVLGAAAAPAEASEYPPVGPYRPNPTGRRLALHPDRPQQRRRRGPGRRVLRPGPDRLGRPHPPGGARVRPRRPEPGRPGPPVRLQQRLPGLLPAPLVEREQLHRPAVVQPRVHQPGADVPELRRGQPDPGPGRHPDPGPRRQHRAHPAGQARRPVPPPAAVPLQPAHHRHHPHAPGRPGRRGRPAQDQPGPERPPGQGDAEQLRRRGHPLGHGADRRGELRPVLRQPRAGRRPADPGPARPLRVRRRAHRTASGSATTTASTWPRSPTSRSASAGWSRSTPTTRTSPRASTPPLAGPSTSAGPPA